MEEIAQDSVRWHRWSSSEVRAERVQAESLADLPTPADDIAHNGSLEEILLLLESFDGLNLEVADEMAVVCGPLLTALERPDLSTQLRQAIKRQRSARLRAWLLGAQG